MTAKYATLAELAQKATPGRCEAWKPMLVGERQCPRPAQYDRWCHFHARSVGGWKLAPPSLLARVQAAEAVVAAARTLHERLGRMVNYAPMQDDIEAVGSALVAYDETTRAPKGGSQP